MVLVLLMIKITTINFVVVLRNLTTHSSPEPKTNSGKAKSTSGFPTEQTATPRAKLTTGVKLMALTADLESFTKERQPVWAATT